MQTAPQRTQLPTWDTGRGTTFWIVPISEQVNLKLTFPPVECDNGFWPYESTPTACTPDPHAALSKIRTRNRTASSRSRGGPSGNARPVPEYQPRRNCGSVCRGMGDRHIG